MVTGVGIYWGPETLHDDRISRKFSEIREEGRAGVIVFLTTGYPDIDATLELVPALARAGADCIELGVPFSDPLAEGPTIQESSFHALAQGVTLAQCLGAVGHLRNVVPDTPLVLMGYYNPFLSYGLSRFAEEARARGVDGVIVPDLPSEESGPLREECGPRGVHVIPMLAPTSTDAQVQLTCAAASGFIYCVSLTGVTGAREELSPAVASLLKRVRGHTGLPLAVGFGVSRREHVEFIGRHAQAAVVGSALIRIIGESPREEMIARASKFVQALRGAAPSMGEGLH